MLGAMFRRYDEHIFSHTIYLRNISFLAENTKYHAFHVQDCAKASKMKGVLRRRGVIALTHFGVIFIPMGRWKSEATDANKHICGRQTE